MPQISISSGTSGRNRIYYLDFIAALERVLERRVRDSFPYEWDEDFITRDLLRDLRARFHDLKVAGFPEMLTTRWSVYKYVGAEEQKYGDIAILVHVSRRGGGSLEGVALLEAKKRSEGSSRFDAIKLPQIRRIVKNAPHSVVLFYDYDKIPSHPVSLASGFEPWYAPWVADLPIVFTTHAVVAPTNVVSALGAKDTSLYRWSIPFSYQLCFRYLHGFDLEISEEAIKAAKGFPSKLGAPRHVLVLSVSEEGVDVGEPELNRDALERL